MDPHKRFCHNRSCWAYARRAGEGHIVIPSRKERRHRCKRCGQTFCATEGTALYRAHKPHELMATVVTLLAYGCPPQAIVAAFCVDERTVSRWQRESRRHSVSASTNISSRSVGCSWPTFRPMSCVSASSAVWCGWHRRSRFVAAFGWAVWCEYSATGA